MWTDPLPEVRARLGRRELEAALSLARSAVVAGDAVFGARHENAAMARLALGEALLATGNVGEAITELERASKSLGREGELVRIAKVDALDDLGLAHAARGEAREAEGCFCRAVEHAEREIGHAHPAVAVALMRLARFYTDGHFEDSRAEPLLRRAVDILRGARALPDEHARALEAYAEVLMDRGADDEAEPLLEERVSLAREQPDAAPSEIAAPLHALATLLARRGQFVRAEALLAEAVTLTSVGGLPTEESVHYETTLADVYRQMNEPDKALAHYRHALEESQELEGPDSLDGAELATRIDELSRPQGHQFG